ncbi:MAG TPA: histidine phosphatase family protein [Actinomycetota bacterium]|nr:histidine phosphatase family protein [Actinomycetota bacterium]
MRRQLDLIIVRHAIAYEQDPLRWPDDAERPLTMEGEVSFRKTARGVAQLTDPPSVSLASPYVRAWRTAEILSEEAGWPQPEPFKALEANRDAQGVLDELNDIEGGPSIALVGHEPMLSELISMLIGGANVELKKGAVARLNAHALTRGGATLRWLLPPKVLRAARR